MGYTRTFLYTNLTYKLASSPNTIPIQRARLVHVTKLSGPAGKYGCDKSDWPRSRAQAGAPTGSSQEIRRDLDPYVYSFYGHNT